MDEKIYCTGCGREIKSGLLYCDRCGQSVKKSRENQAGKSKAKQIEELHRERLNRKERRKEKEKKQREKKRKVKKHIRVILFIVLIALIAIISAVASYIAMSTGGGIKDRDDEITENIALTPVPTAAAQTSTGTTADNRNTSFKMLEYNGIMCPYPVSFMTGASGGKELMHLADTAGGAVMMISTEENAGNGKEMMVEYLKTAGGELSYSRASDNWYAVTVNTGEQIKHRKLVIKNNTALYYDFIYGTDSPCADEYEICITNLDENFTDGADSLH